MNSLVHFQREFIYSLIRANGLATMLEFGSTVAAPSEMNCRHIAEAFSSSPSATYGVSPRAADPGLVHAERADLAASIGLNHLFEDEAAFEAHLRRLFTYSKRFVLIYGIDRNRVLRRDRGTLRQFSKIIADRHHEWRRIGQVPASAVVSAGAVRADASEFFIYALSSEGCDIRIPPQVKAEI